MYSIVLFTALFLSILIYCPKARSQDIILMPQWILNDQYAGEIHAHEQMDKTNSGVKIILLPYDETKDQYQEVLSRRVDVSTSEVITLLQKINEDQSDIVIFSLKEQISPAGYLSLKDKHIESPKDLEGKNFGYYSNNTLNHLKWFCMLHSIDYNKIKLKKITSDNLVSLIDGKVEVIVAHDTNEPIVLKKIGYDTNFIPMYGPANIYYGSAYFTTRSFYESNKENLREFVRKVSEGWKWAIEHPEQAADMVMKYYPKSRYLMDSYTLTRDKVIKGINVRAFHLTYNVGVDCIGCISKIQWNAGIDALVKHQLIEDSVHIRNVARFDIVDRVFSHMLGNRL